MKKYFILGLVLFLGLGISLMNCFNDLTPLKPEDNLKTGSMGFTLSFDPASEVASGTVTITKGNITLTKSITIVDHQGTVTFDNIQVGQWHILVQLFDADGYEIYTGEDDAIVLKDQTTTVNITVKQNTGNLNINVTIPALVLWNKLGSQAEVENSEVGVGGTIQGNLNFDSAMFGNGIVTYDIDNYLIFSNFNLNLDSNKITIELWWKANIDRTAWTGIRRLFYASDTVGSNQIALFLNPTSVGENSGFPQVVVRQEGIDKINYYFSSSEINWNIGELHHWAIVLDGSESSGGNRVKLYWDGIQILPFELQTDSEFGNFSKMNIEYTFFGRWSGYDSGGVIDNLKIYKDVKTDFSDRFTE